MTRFYPNARSILWNGWSDQSMQSVPCPSLTQHNPCPGEGMPVAKAASLFLCGVDRTTCGVTLLREVSAFESLFLVGVRRTTRPKEAAI